MSIIEEFCSQCQSPLDPDLWHIDSLEHFVHVEGSKYYGFFSNDIPFDLLAFYHQLSATLCDLLVERWKRKDLNENAVSVSFSKLSSAA